MWTRLIFATSSYIGSLDVSELKDALSDAMKMEVPYHQVQELLDEFDKDGNGSIDISEFTMMTVSTNSEREIIIPSIETY